MKKISVIIPCYKNSETLERAIQSLLNQSVEVDEIVIVNDDSPETDQIEKIISRFPSITYIKSKQNIGSSAARNLGIKKAKNDLLAFLDADDEMHYQKLEKQLQVLEPNTAVTTDFIRLEHVNEKWRQTFFSQIQPKLYSKSKQIIYRNVLTGASMLTYKDILLRLGGYDRKLKSAEDFDLWLRMLDEGIKVHRINQPLYGYFVSPNGLTANYEIISYWEFEVIKNYIKRNSKLSQFSKSLILLVWLSKESIKNEIVKDQELAILIKKNSVELSEYRFLYLFFRVLNHFSIFRLLAFIKKLK